MTTTVGEGFEDFERYRDKQAWEKAFTALNTTAEARGEGLTAQKDGFFVPLSSKARNELLSLSPAGREAFRLFNDAKAKQIYDQIVSAAEDLSGADEISDEVLSLRRVVDRYFITSIGDRAADRLGDALFETGDFEGAARTWQLILDNYPDTGLSPVLLQTKCAIALARAGRWEQFQTILGRVHDRHGGESVVLGGKSVIAADYLDGLSPDAAAATEPADRVGGIIPSTLTGTIAGRAALPADDTPAWQIPLMDDATAKQIQTSLGQFGWGQMAGEITTAVPPTAVDGKRIYVNWFGTCFAADLNNGKMLWRTDALTNLAQNMQQMVMRGQSVNISANSIVVAGDHVLLVQAPMTPNNMGNQTLSARFDCLSAENGHVIWGSGDALPTWSFRGVPVAADEGIYVCATPENEMELHLLCVSAGTGRLRWEVDLGAEAPSTNMRGQPEMQSPAILKHQGKVYVLTNNGAVLAVDPSAKAVDWAFTFPANVTQQQMYYNYSAPVDPRPPGAMLARGTTLYIKETKSEEMYALDLSGPSLKWKRPIDPSVTLAGGDDRGLYVVGKEIDRLDADSRAMLWSDKLSVATSTIRPAFVGDHVYVFGSRGIHDIGTSTGNVGPIFRGYDRDSSGGAIWYSGGRLITVSGGEITAYSIPNENKP